MPTIIPAKPHGIMIIPDITAPITDVRTFLPENIA
jgi:hypothetical protein